MIDFAEFEIFLSCIFHILLMLAYYKITFFITLSLSLFHAAFCVITLGLSYEEKERRHGRRQIMAFKLRRVSAEGRENKIETWRAVSGGKGRVGNEDF